jgi:hypothetical protein
MPHPFSPDDFPIDEDAEMNPSRIFYLKGTIHFKNDAAVHDLTGKIRRPFDDFGHKFMDEVGRTMDKISRNGDTPAYRLQSSGSMMRTIKTIVDGATGDKLCDLNMTFVSFDNSSVRFPAGSKHSRHEIELFPVNETDARSGETRHEGFVRHSIPYFWDMTGGQFGTLYKCLNQKRVEVGMVAGYGWGKDAVLVFDDDEVDEVVAAATCIILLNGRDAIDY